MQFIWQFGYFNKRQLQSTLGEKIEVLLPGQPNHNQGPDFLEARVRIGNTLWIGSAELHLHTSGWVKHGHQGDRNYQNVILHVVWEDDSEKNIAVTGLETEPAAIPVLELKDRVPKLLLQQYAQLLSSASFIPCEKMIRSVSGLVWKSWKERLLAERLLRKTAMIEQWLLQSHYHWEEVFWWMLARNFGMKVNAAVFEATARSLPLTVLTRHKSQLQQLEALLFGQAGLLKGRFTDAYPKLLQHEYAFLCRKNTLQQVHEPVYFLRMRPGNFPTVRMAQLAALVHQTVHLFSHIKEAASVKEVRDRLDVRASDYWNRHYRFDEPSVEKVKQTGAAMIDTLIINTVVPMLFTYGHYHQENAFKEKALQWLEETAVEHNSITKAFAVAGIGSKTAYDSQGLIELKNMYCGERRCLECAVGNEVLKNSKSKK